MEKEAKKTTVKAAKPAVKKATGKKPAAKAAVKSSVTLEFNGNSYSYDDLVKNAKNVYRYDMKKKVSDIKAIDLYVKPEESPVYFVVNGEENGCYSL